MKKLTFLTLVCSISLLSYAAGGNIIYELNGGVTNDYGWKNKADMLVGLNQDYNTVYEIAPTAPLYTWETLDVIMGAADPVTRIPTFATKMFKAIDLPQWKWLQDYIVATVKEQSLPDIAAGEAGDAFWRYNVSAFFVNGKRAGWPVSADYAIAGQTEAFIPTWKHAFAGPTSYDGTAEVIIPNPYKEGFTFDGWYESDDFLGEKITSIPEGATGDKKLYAKWVEYIPTCAEVWAFGAGVDTKASGFVTFINGKNVYVQDATAGLFIEFTNAPEGLKDGDKIIVSGKTALIGEQIKIENAGLLTKESGTVPASQTISLANLIADAANSYKTYMYKLIYMEGLNIKSYNANDNFTLTDGINTITASGITLNQTELPVNTKVNVKLVVAYDTDVMLVGSAQNVTEAPLAKVDPYTYPEKNEIYTLKNRWLISNALDNLSANAIGITDHVRGMAAKDGKMLFIDRNLKQITVVNGTTGAKEAPIKLASNIFTYVNNEGATVSAGTLPFNDIKLDSKGNVLLGNCITSNAGRFQVWKVDLATGSGTLVVDADDLLTLYPEATTMRFDAFGVYGDVDNDAIILAANAMAMEVYKWTITGGVAGATELIELDNLTAGTTITGLANPGSAPQVFPMDEYYFYLDGNATYPTLIDMEGLVVDGFHNNTALYDDSETVPGSTFTMNEGHNGVTEFTYAEEEFLLLAASNTVKAPFSSFRLFKYKDANKEFKDMELMWTFPAAGMGAASNSYRTAVPSVEVNDDKAILYLYTGENGYGVYEFTNKNANSIPNIKNDLNISISVNNKTLQLSEEVASLEVFGITGQLVNSARNTSAIDVLNGGIYIVKVTTIKGETGALKVIVK